VFVLVVCSLLRVLPLRSLVLLAPVVYLIALIRPLSRKGLFSRLYHQVALDVTFFMTGLCAYLFLR